MRIVGILLAAGQGSRFGGGKLIARLAGGAPVGIQAARNLKAALPECVAVVRSDDSELAQMLRSEGIAVELCERAHEGMGVSLAHAIRACADADGWVVALADMPLIAPSTVARIADALRGGALIAAPIYAGQRGHPVGFAGVFGPRLSALSGDAGARDLLRAEADRMVLIEVNDPGVLADIDTREQLARFSAQPLK